MYFQFTLELSLKIYANIMQSTQFLVPAKCKHRARSCVFELCPFVSFLSASSFFNQSSAAYEDNSKSCE